MYVCVRFGGHFKIKAFSSFLKKRSHVLKAQCNLCCNCTPVFRCGFFISHCRYIGRLHGLNQRQQLLCASCILCPSSALSLLPFLSLLRCDSSLFQWSKYWLASISHEVVLPLNRAKFGHYRKWKVLITDNMNSGHVERCYGGYRCPSVQ